MPLQNKVTARASQSGPAKRVRSAPSQSSSTIGWPISVSESANGSEGARQSQLLYRGGGEPSHSQRVANSRALDYESGVLEYATSSLFESPAQTLVNTVNTVGVMGKGIANDFRRLYPDMFEKYRKFCAEKRFAVGQLYLHRTPHKWVLNFPTKKHWRSPSRLEWIEDGLKKFVESYSRYGITSIAFPQLGTGNGGLDWDDVRPMMEHYLRPIRIPVYIHTRRPDPKFVPEHLSSVDYRDLSRELHAPRVDVTFEQFVDDFRRVFHAHVKQPQGTGELPGLEMRIGGQRTLTVPGEQVLDFWQTLKVRGALEPKDVPIALQDRDLGLFEKLVTLEYIKPMLLGDGREQGLRYAPPSLSLVPTAIDVNPE